jgi:hypothetical protein
MNAFSSTPTADYIANLPVSQTPATPSEDLLAGHLFGTQQSLSRVSSVFRKPLLAGAITGLMMMPVADELIFKFYPGARENQYVLIICKILVAACLFYLADNWAFARA